MMSNTPSILELRDLTVSYTTPVGRIRALNNVSFSIAQGEVVGLVGESGSGKSTVALAVLGLLADEASLDSGKIVYRGEDLRALPTDARVALRGDKISTVFQDPFTSLNPALTIGLQVAEPLMEHQGMGQTAAMEKVVSLLEEVGIPRPAAVARAYPHELSGGMQQRVLIATALACEPDLLILDEPTTALDVTIEAQILDLLINLRREHQLSVLFITHNLGIVSRLCDKVCVLYAGQVLEFGKTRDVLFQPHHPYTKGLMASLPQIHFEHCDRLPSIAGAFPSLRDLPQGCVFHTRCPFAEELCGSEASVIEDLDGSRAVRCRRVADVRDLPWPETDTTSNGPKSAKAGDGDHLVTVTNLVKRFHLGGLLASLRVTMNGGLPKISFNPSVLHAVNGVNLSISKGEVVGLVGESGCGKTTFGRIIVRLVDPSDGTIVIDDQDVTTAAESTLRPLRQKAQIVFQNPDSSLNPRAKIGEAIDRPLVLFENLTKAERRTRVDELLTKVGLPASYAERYPHQLSGGEKQRVGIARALASSPEFIVLDEAVSALDVSVQATILNLLSDLQDELGLAYLFISHDLAVVAHIADRIAVMYAGEICEIGTAEQVLKPPYHPYTEALLSAVPLVDAEIEGRNRIRLTGDVETATSAPRGCSFHRRCPHKVGDICERETPPEIEAANGHHIACHVPLKELEAMASAVPLRLTPPGTTILYAGNRK